MKVLLFAPVFFRRKYLLLHTCYFFPHYIRLAISPEYLCQLPIFMCWLVETKSSVKMLGTRSCCRFNVKTHTLKESPQIAFGKNVATSYIYT